MRRKRNWLCVILTLCLFLLSSATVYGGEEGSGGDTTLAPYFFVEGEGNEADHFPLKETKVSANINGVIAETYVTQTYSNEGTSPIDASYVFPASSKVSVHGAKMRIGDKIITAQIKERGEARDEFEEAKAEGKSASLLEQQRPNVFSMDVANIMPGDTIQIELHYTEMVSSTDGVYQFVFPTVVGPRYAGAPDGQQEGTDQWVTSPYLKEGDTPPGKYEIAVQLSTGVPITQLSSKSHKIDVKQESQSSAAVTLSNPEEYAGDRDFILDYKLTGQSVSCGLMLNSDDSENFFMLMIQPPERVKTEDIPPREYIFVLDVSGSMNGYPLETAQDLIRNLVGNLRETDRFNLILFSGASSRMAPQSVPATAANIRQAIELINRQQGGGGTELASALESAIAIPKDDNVARSMVVITDGYISDEREIFDIIHQNLDTTSFFSFGIGTSVNRYLIDGVAKAGLGESFVVTDSSEAQDTAERFKTYIESPVLTDLHVTYDGFDTYEIEPDSLPTLFAQKPVVLFGKWKGEKSGTIRISGKTGSEDYSQEINVAGTDSLAVNDAIPYLWARTKVERLTDYRSTVENEDAVKKEVTAIGLKYRMMTPYTSFVAVMDTVRNKDGQNTDVEQPLPLPSQVSGLAVGGGYTIGSEPGGIILIAAMACFLSLGAVLRRLKKKAAAERGAGDDIR